MSAKREWFASHNFVMIHLDLIDMGLSLEAVLLLDRIKYRSGDDWWTVTKAEMQAETRLSERKLDRAIKELRDLGLVEWKRTRPFDPTLEWRVRFEDEQSAPLVKDETSLTEKDETSFTPISKKKRTSPSTSRSMSEIQVLESAEFIEFWTLYPKKAGKQAAARAFAKATKRTDVECVLVGLRNQRTVLEAKKREGFCPDPATWLNAGRWDDEVTPRQTERRRNYDDWGNPLPLPGEKGYSVERHGAPPDPLPGEPGYGVNYV